MVLNDKIQFITEIDDDESDGKNNKKVKNNFFKCFLEK